MSFINDDEEIARRLHMAERAHEEEIARRKANAEAERMDVDLARYYARLYLEQQQRAVVNGGVISNTSSPQQRSRVGPSHNYSASLSSNNTVALQQFRDGARNIGPNGISKSSLSDQFQQHHSGTDFRQQPIARDQLQVGRVGSRDLERYAGEVGYTNQKRSAAQVSPEYVHRAMSESTDRLIRAEDSRSLVIDRQKDPSRAKSESRSVIVEGSHVDSLLGYPKQYSAESSRSKSENEMIANPEPRRIATSADIEYARQLQEKAFSNLQRKNIESYHASLNIQVDDSPELRRHSTVTPGLEYARRLQELAFSDLHRSSSQGIQVAPPVDFPSPSGLEFNADEELARKMQNLENQGLGRLNSDRQLVTVELSDEESESERRYGTGKNPGQIYGTRTLGAHSLRREDEDARLARLMQESDVSFSQLPADLVNEVLHQSRGTPSAAILTQQQRSAQSHAAQMNTPQDRQPPHRTSSLPSPHTQQQRAAGVLSLDPTNAGQTLSLTDRRGFLPSDCDSSIHSMSTAQSSPVKPEESLRLDQRTARRPETPSESSTHSDRTPISNLLRSSAAIQKVAAAAATAPTTPGKKKKGFLGFGNKKEVSKEKSPKVAPATPLSSFLGSSQKSPHDKKSSSVKKSTSSARSGSLLSSDSASSAASGAYSRDPSASAPPPVIPVRREPAGVPPRGIPPPPPGVIPAPGQIGSLRPAPKPKFTCAGCGQSNGSFLRALDKKYHPECFRCVSCNGKIDSNSQFKFSSDPLGVKHPHHLDCFVRTNGIQCSVCRLPIPASADGKIAFVKHPFFSTEHMCVHHAEVPHRRCSGCQRFEPEDKPFIDLMDDNRCVCPACCRTVVFDSTDAEPLWKQVIYFFEFKLKLPVWDQMREIPILLVGSDELRSQMRAENSVHANSSQIMTAGLCLTACEAQMSIVAILCLSGLPRDLTLSILSREATLAWFRLHPKYDISNPLPSQVEEGVAQLIAYLFLSEAIRSSEETDAANSYSEDADGPSDEKLRQYFKFTIERDNHEIYGTGYRRAAVAYREIGIEELLDHVMKFGDFPMPLSI